jgi:hypothetical protein
MGNLPFGLEHDKWVVVHCQGTSVEFICVEAFIHWDDCRKFDSKPFWIEDYCMFSPQISSRNVPGLQNSMEQQHLHPSKLEDSYRLISLQDNIILLDLHEIRLHLVLQFPFQAKWHLGKLNQHSALRKAVKPHGGDMTRGRFKLHLLQQMQTRLLQVMLRRFR